MREMHPIVPLGHRVPKPAKMSRAETEVTQICDDAERDLTDYEAGMYHGITQDRLSQLHDQAFEKFVRRLGFGMSRVPWDALTLIEQSPPPVPTDEHSKEESTELAESRTDFSPAELLALPKLHSNAFVDFVSPGRLGVVPIFTTTATSQSEKPALFWSQLPADSPLRPLSVRHSEHGMSAQVKDSFEKRLTEWRLSSLELVSLLKSPEPRVYLSRNLPNMKELDSAPTRELNEFETNSLQKLSEGEHLLIESDNTEIRMLGSIRAANQCVGCHQVQRGYLLGAFTYILHRIPTSTEAAQSKSGQ